MANTKKQTPCSICGVIPSIGRKLCKLHYHRAWRAGTLERHAILNSEDAFQSRYKIVESGCWEWQGHTNGYGYGILMLPGEKLVRAHRYSYERSKGPIPEGKVVMHSCDNPPCVNPDHLSVGTKLDNNRDSLKKGRRPAGDRHWMARAGEVPRFQGKFVKTKAR